MSERITATNLESVVERNLEIQDEVQREVRQFLSTGRYVQSQSKPQLALTVLKSYGLVQLPVNDSYWSGALFVKEGKTEYPTSSCSQGRRREIPPPWRCRTPERE